MTISTDYEDYMAVGKDMLDNLHAIIDGTTFIKAAQVETCFQTRNPGVLWGETVEDKTYTVQKNYPVMAVDNLSDAAVIARLEQKISKKSDIHQVLAVAKEVVELLSDLQLNKYPNLVAMLYDEVKKVLDDEALFTLINMYLLGSTALLSDENPKKIHAEAFSKLSIESEEAQNLLATIRHKMVVDSPTDLSHEARTFLITVIRMFIEDLEKQEKELKEMKETLQLPINSEEVRQLIAPMREKILEENKKAEEIKLLRCFRDAIIHLKVKSGEKSLLSVNVKLVYINKSDPHQDLLYEKKIFNRPLGQSPAV